MTTFEPVAARSGRPSLAELAPNIPAEISQSNLVQLVRTKRERAHEAGERMPGRLTLAAEIGVSKHRVRRALETIATVDQLPHEHDHRTHNKASVPPPKAAGAVTQAVTAEPSSAPVAPPPGDRSLPAVRVPSERDDHGAPPGASSVQPPTMGRARVRGDITGSLVRAAVLISMFVLAAAVWVKAADLSGHQVELGTLPVVGWPIRLAYFAPILVEGAVYAAIRICHTLDYVKDATRGYARRTAIIGLVAMVLVGATVGLGFADEPYVRDVIGGLIGGLGPFMGWRTSRASAMVAGDRRAAVDGRAPAAEPMLARPNRFAGLLDTLATAATARMSSWGHKSNAGARATPDGGTTSGHDVVTGQPGCRDHTSMPPQIPDAGAGQLSSGAAFGRQNGAPPNGSPTQHHAGREQLRSRRRT